MEYCVHKMITFILCTLALSALGFGFVTHFFPDLFSASSRIGTIRSALTFYTRFVFVSFVVFRLHIRSLIESMMRFQAIEGNERIGSLQAILTAHISHTRSTRINKSLIILCVLR